MSKYDVSRIDESMMRVSKESAADFNMSQPVVLCPGVKIASRANIFLSDSESDDEELGNGFGPNVQTLSGDIEHLSIVFPGMFIFAWYVLAAVTSMDAPVMRILLLVISLLTSCGLSAH